MTLINMTSEKFKIQSKLLLEEYEFHVIRIEGCIANVKDPN